MSLKNSIFKNILINLIKFFRKSEYDVVLYHKDNRTSYVYLNSKRDYLACLEKLNDMKNKGEIQSFEVFSRANAS